MRAQIDTVVTTCKLSQRPPRAPDFQAENRALGALSQTLALSPRSVLQKVADYALQLCQAHSAGISLLEERGGESVFRWRALSGRCATQLRGMPRPAFSPCGTVLDRDAIQLMARPVRHVPHIEALDPEIEEALLIPFHLNHTPLGTIWVVAHDQTRRFDAEDARLIGSLGRFAAGACEVLRSLDHFEAELAAQRKAAALALTADRHKDRFIAILAHELRGPLSPIKHAVEVLKRETLDIATARRASEIISRQVAEMAGVIDDLCDVSRMRLGSLELHRTRAAVADIISRTLETSRPFVASRGHTLIVDMGPEPMFLEADVMWLSHALQNLVSNAAKYTNPGGQISISAEREGSDVVMTVSDTGIGIAAAQLDAIFELYAQADQGATERSEGGLGIGLYLARRLVEAHGGTIRAVSPGPGRGSEFIVRLPCNPLALPDRL